MWLNGSVHIKINCSGIKLTKIMKQAILAIAFPLIPGSIHTQFYLTSDRYVSKRLIENISKAACLLMECVFQGLFRSFASFWIQKNQSVSWRTLKTLLKHSIKWIPLMIWLIFCGIATFAFIAKLIIYQFRKRHI